MSILKRLALLFPPIKALYLERNSLAFKLSELKTESTHTLKKILKKLNLFIVNDMIIEAPPQIVSQHVCDALEKQGYETVELYLARNIIKTGDTVLDMGSGLGLSSITAAKASGGSRVVGYEADPKIALLAQQNGLLNKVNIEIRNKAVQKIAGSIDFFLADNFLANSAYPIKDAKKVSIQAVAFEEILNEIHPDVITCDIEGAEGDIFANVDLSSVRAMIVETHPQFIGKDGVYNCIKNLKESGLNLVERLCWGPVLVFNRDGSTSSVIPFQL